MKKILVTLLLITLSVSLVLAGQGRTSFAATQSDGIEEKRYSEATLKNEFTGNLVY